MSFKFRANEHYLGNDLKSYEVVDEDGTVFGVVQQYNGYVDKKALGSRIVTTRKNKKLWMYKRDNDQASYGHRSRNAAFESMTWAVR